MAVGMRCRIAEAVLSAGGTIIAPEQAEVGDTPEARNGRGGHGIRAVLAAGGWVRPASPALPLRLGELSEQAHEELRQGWGRDRVGAAVRGAPA
jgi:hypothetical protein